MSTWCNRCNAKVLRPERCVALGGAAPCSACTEDIELEKEMDELEIRVEKIHIRRRALRTVMNQNHDCLIHKLPPEIISHIFVQPQYAPPSPHPTRKYINHSPLYLGAVCEKWRQLAWATPQLWSSLHVKVKRIYGTREYPFQLVAEWLERSASLPLSIRLSTGWDLEHIQYEDKAYARMINILNEHSARWYDIHLTVPVRHLHRFRGSSQGNMLRRLALLHSYHIPSDFSTFSMKSKPSPTDLTLMTVGLAYVDIAWNNLTTASLICMRVDECVELILRAPLLESLTLHEITMPSDISLDSNKRIVHPRLHSLEFLGSKDETAVARFLDSVNLPSLEKWIHNRSSFPLNNVLSFIEHISSGLKRFKIISPNATDLCITGVFPHLSSLEFLELRTDQYNTTDELLDLLCHGVSDESPLFLPCLQSLEIDCGPSVTWKYLPRVFASSRWRSLRVKVDIKRYHWNEIKDEAAKPLLELVDKGFDFSIVMDGKIDVLQEYKDSEKCHL